MGVIITHFKSEDNNRGQYNKQQTIKTTTSSEHKQHKFSRPKLNKNPGGPKFATLDFNNFYATRHYAKTAWASTIEHKPTSIEHSWKNAKPRLQKYFSGRNACKNRIPLTCPLLIRVSTATSATATTTTTTAEENSNDNANTPEDVTLSLPLPKEHADNPPGPQDKAVFISEEYKRIYYTGFFHKQLREENIQYNIRNLKSKLVANEEKINGDVCYVAIYETQRKSFAQIDYYEIWFEGLREDRDYICVQNYEDEEEEEA